MTQYVVSNKKNMTSPLNGFLQPIPTGVLIIPATSGDEPRIEASEDLFPYNISIGDGFEDLPDERLTIPETGVEIFSIVKTGTPSEFLPRDRFFSERQVVAFRDTNPKLLCSERGSAVFFPLMKGGKCFVAFIQHDFYGRFGIKVRGWNFATRAEAGDGRFKVVLPLLPTI